MTAAPEHSSIPAEAPARPPTRPGTAMSAWLVLLLGTAATFFATQSALRNCERVDNDRFEMLAGRASEAIKDHFDRLTQDLSSLRGIFVGSQRVERAEFRALMSCGRNGGESADGAGMGFIRRVNGHRVNEFLEETRADGEPGFTISPPPLGQDVLMVVEFSEPTGSTPIPCGLDVATIESCRAAALDAAQRNEPRLSRASRMEHDAANGLRLFLMPIARSQESNEEEGAGLLGWAFTPVDVERIAAKAQAAAGDDVAVGLMEAGVPLAGAAQPVAAHDERVGLAMRAGGLDWTMTASPTARFARTPRTVPWSLGIGGALTTLVAFLLLGRTERQRMAAEDASEKVAERLRSHAGEMARLALVAQCTSNAVVITDAQGRVDWVNDGFVRITGFSREEACGRMAADVLCCDQSAPATLAMIQGALRDAVACRVEVLNRTKAGQEHWIDLEIQPLRSHEGRLTGFIAVESDITAQVEMRNRLRRQAEGLTDMSRMAKVGRWALDLTSNSLTWCEQVRAIHEVPADFEPDLESAIGFYAEDSREAIRGAVDRAINRGESFDLELRVITAKGRTIFVRALGRPVTEGGRLTGVAGAFQDITNERLASSKLAESQRILQSVLNVLPQRVFWKDVDGRYLGANEAFLKDAGLDSVVGKTDDDMPWVGKQAELYRLADRAVIALDMAEMDIVEPQSRSDGSLGWLSTCKVPLHDSEGRVTGVLGTYMDITQSRAAEQALRESEARFRAMADAAPVLVWMADTDGRCFFFNRSWLEFTGRGLEEEQNEGWLEGVHPDDRERCMRTYADAFARRESFEMEYRLRRYDGEYRWLVDRGVPRMAESEKFLGYIGGCMDIQDSRQAQVSLAEAEQQIRSLINNIPGVSYRCEGTGPRMMTFISDAMETLTGYPASDFLRNSIRSFDQIVDPEDSSRVQESLAAAVRSREPYELEYRIRRADGQQRWVRERGRGVFDAAGDLKCIDGAIFDVTGQRRDAEALKAAKEAAEAASLTKSEFLANMSHEIRTPMTAILGFADLLREDGDVALAPTRRLDAIDTIRRNGEHLLAIINDILDLSKIEAGKLTLSCATVRPIQMVEELISLLGVRAKGKGLSLKSEFRGRIPETIDTDPVRLRQVLMNLVGNALKFTEVGGVTVGVSSRAQPDGTTSLRFDIEDTGIGMTPEQQSRLFRPFMQADESTTRRFGGTGLGLTISQRLAEMLRGEIQVSSRVGRGSTFSFEMNLGRVREELLVVAGDPAASVRKEPPQSVQGMRLDGLRILLVEDGPDNQRLISFHLQRAGAAVTIADNGRVGVDLMSSEGKLIEPCPFDVVLMDMQMPVLDGYAAARLLRSMGCRTPIVALTAHAMSGDAEVCLNAGCDDYSTKPIDRAVLLALCRKWAEARVSARAA